MNKHILSTHVIALLLPLSALHAAEFFVAPNGSDASVGSKEQPFATLEKARDTVRALNAAGKYPAEGVTVWLRGGVYLRDHSFDLA